jgi:hypothetical protein
MATEQSTEFEFHRHHLVKYKCKTTGKYYGVLQPSRTTFWIREGDIEYPEYEWKIKLAVSMPHGWKYKGVLPKRICVTHPRSEKHYTFKCSRFYTTEVELDRIGSIEGEMHLRGEVETLN